MTISSAKYLKNKAGKRLESGREPKQVALWYAGIVAVSSFLVTLIRYVISQQISKYGGLTNIGLRSMLETADRMLGIILFLLLTVLELGYIAAMLRIGRNQFASPKTLKAGAERFWLLLKTRLLQYIIYTALAIVTGYAATTIFLLSPFSSGIRELLLPYTADSAFSPELILNDELLMSQMTATLIPMFILYALIYIPCIIWISYRYRLVNYIIIDNPGVKARTALKQSSDYMKGNKLRLFKVDLSFWWYYLLRALTVFLLYIDLFLPLVGIRLPESPILILTGTLLLSLGADFAITLYLRNQVEVTYALAYNELVPKEDNSGAVLGNIFRM